MSTKSKVNWREAGLKAWETRRKNAQAKQAGKATTSNATPKATKAPTKGKTNWSEAGKKAWATRRKNLAAKTQPEVVTSSVGTRELRMLIPMHSKVIVYSEGKEPVSI